MKIIQRFGNDNQLDEKFMDYLIACKNKYPNCVNEVWLTTAYGFPTLKTHAEIAQKLIAVADKLRKKRYRRFYANCKYYRPRRVYVEA